jgi:hypothetical protein
MVPKSKILITVVALLLGASVGSVVVSVRKSRLERVDYSEQVRFVLEQIRTLKMPDGSPQIGSSARIMGRPPHPFYLLTRYVNAVAMGEDLTRMLQDKHPSVRIAAAVAIIGGDLGLMDKKAADFLLNDTAVVWVIDGSFPQKISVGQVVEALKKNPRLLEQNFRVD